MITKRTSGTAAAVGGFTAAIALLTGLSGARADELSDLRANQDLLQRRLDQLAQSANPGAGTYLGTSANAARGAAAAGGSFPRSFLIPGTDTSIRIGGFVDFTADYWLSGGPPNSSPQTTTVMTNGQLPGAALDVHGQFVPGLGAPIAGVPGGIGNVGIQLAHSRGHVFSASARESRISLETRTPTAWGEARTYIEFDWAGCNNFSCLTSNHVSNNLVPRLRHAYGTLGGILAGQANSNFRDADADFETLDFGGSAGQAGVVRIPQIRYTRPVWFGGAISVSAESPQTDVASAGGIVFSDTNATALPGGPNAAALNNFTKSTAPDVTLAYYLPQPWGHFNISGVLRDLDINDGRFVSREYLGWGLHVSGDIKPGWWGWSRDTITWQVTGGQGIGRYLNEGSGVGLATNLNPAVGATVCSRPGFAPTGVAAATCSGIQAASNVIVKPVVAFGASMGYQHFWRDNLRSTVVVGFRHQDVNSQLIGPAQSVAINKELFTTHANLIWSPVSFVDVGVEYAYGHRVVVANLKGDVNTVIGKFRVRF